MVIETIGEASSYGWRIRARCTGGKVDNRTSARECVYRAELDLPTLIWTRGRAFPLSLLESRLRCPICGSRNVSLMFEVPTEPMAKRAV